MTLLHLGTITGHTGEAFPRVFPVMWCYTEAPLSSAPQYCKGSVNILTMVSTKKKKVKVTFFIILSLSKYRRWLLLVVVNNTVSFFFSISFCFLSLPQTSDYFFP